MSEQFSHKPNLINRWVWAIAEAFGVLRPGYLAALTDQALLEKAEYFIRLSQHGKAQLALNALARRELDEPKSLTTLANLELRNGNKEVARRAQLRAAQAYLRRGAIDEATHVLQQILALARDCLEARLALGQIAEGRYEHEEAVAHYVEAVKVLTARQDWGGVQELLERVRQLQRVKTVLDSDTQMMPAALGPGAAAVSPISPRTPDAPMIIAEAETKYDIRPSVQDDTDPLGMRIPPASTIRNMPPADSELSSPDQSNNVTLADIPSPLRAQKPSTVIVDMDAAAEATLAVPLPRGQRAPIPSTFVRTAKTDETPSVNPEHTDIVIRDVPPDVMVNFDTAVDFDPRKLLAERNNTPVDPPSVVVQAAPRRSGSVWDRAIVQGPKEQITLNVGPEVEDPAEAGPSIIRRATTGISQVISGFRGTAKGGGGQGS